MNDEVLSADGIERGQSRWPHRGLAQTARLLGISNNLVYEAAARGEIPTVKIGRRVLVPRAALNRLLGAEAA
jgi:excisionase family DNA binding protein